MSIIDRSITHGRAIVQRPLEGIRVLSLTQWLLGPATTQYLSDMGADVIKIERPGQGAWERSWSGANAFVGGESVFYWLANRNCRSVAVDMSTTEGADIIRALVEEADVLISNFRPGVLERFGLGYREVTDTNPRLIYAIGSGYGSEGSASNLPGQDLLLQARSGLAHINSKEGAPVQAIGTALIDQHAASLLAMGILGALVERAASNEGQRVEVTMMDAAVDLQTEALSYHLNGALLRRPTTPIGSAFHQAPYGIYEATDGFLAISMSPLADVVAHLGQPDAADLPPNWSSNPEVADPRDEAYEIVQALLSRMTVDDAIERLRKGGMWCERVQSYEDLMEDALVRDLGIFIDVGRVGGTTIKGLRHPVRYGPDGAFSVDRPPPGLGEHTSEVLLESGYSRSEIDALAESGTIECADASIRSSNSPSDFPGGAHG